MKIRCLILLTNLDTKINEIKTEMPSIRGLATTSALIAVGNKICNVNNLIKKADFDTKLMIRNFLITDHNHDKCVTTPEFNKLTA